MNNRKVASLPGGNKPAEPLVDKVAQAIYATHFRSLAWLNASDEVRNWARDDALAMTAKIPLRAAGMKKLAVTDYRALIAISCQANDDGKAYLSLTMIAALTGIGRSKVPCSIRNLEAAGLLRAQRRKYDDGGDASTVYEIVVVA
jgi:biotin operon repressor